MRNRVLIILKDNSGASIIYVLSVMLFLMAIGVSVLTAAGANAGFTSKQKDHSQAVILADSVQRNILYSLQHYDVNDENRFLSTKLVRILCEAHDPHSILGYRPNDLLDMPIDINLDNGFKLDGNAKVESIKLSFTQQAVDIQPKPEMLPVPAIPPLSWTDEDGNEYYNPGAPRIPKTAGVEATMTVTVSISINNKIVMNSRAHYKYTGGALSDDPESRHYYDYTYDDIPRKLEFVPGRYGEWRLIKHEKVDM